MHIIHQIIISHDIILYTFTLITINIETPPLLRCRGDWLLRITAYIGLSSGEDLTSDMMVFILCNATSHVQVSLLHD